MMEGYGRLVALGLFLSLISYSMSHYWFNDRKQFWMNCLLFVLVPIASIVIFGGAYFIYNYW
jgi:putative effector of murein hydrolase